MTFIDIAKLIIEALRVLSWPLLIIFLVVVYRRPLRGFLNNLVSKFSEANKVSIGSLSLEIQEKAREVGNPELAQRVGSLSPRAVEELLLTPRDGGMGLISTSNFQGEVKYGLPKEKVMDALRELEIKRFVVFSEDLTEFLRELKTMRSDDGGGSNRTWFRSTQPKGSPPEERFHRITYKLTDLGRQAADTIVKVVAAQLGQS
jgi:hypothetical protein